MMPVGQEKLHAIYQENPLVLLAGPTSRGPLSSYAEESGPFAAMAATKLRQFQSTFAELTGHYDNPNSFSNASCACCAS
eukprot:g28598.t1